MNPPSVNLNHSGNAQLLQRPPDHAPRCLGVRRPFRGYETPLAIRGDDNCVRFGSCRYRALFSRPSDHRIFGEVDTTPRSRRQPSSLFLNFLSPSGASCSSTSHQSFVFALPPPTPLVGVALVVISAIAGPDRKHTPWTCSPLPPNARLTSTSSDTISSTHAIGPLSGEHSIRRLARHNSYCRLLH